jgi:hypothetical protein
MDENRKNGGETIAANADVSRSNEGERLVKQTIEDFHT